LLQGFEQGYKILLSKKAVLYHSLADRKQKLGLQFREHNAARYITKTRNRLFAMSRYGKKYRSFFIRKVVD